MPVEFLSDEQAAAYGRFNGAPGRAELERCFFLDDADRELVRRRRSEQNRLGFALQLTTVRFLETFLADPLDVPWVVVEYLGPPARHRRPVGGEGVLRASDDAVGAHRRGSPRLRLHRLRWRGGAAAGLPNSPGVDAGGTTGRTVRPGRRVAARRTGVAPRRERPGPPGGRGTGRRRGPDARGAGRSDGRRAAGSARGSAGGAERGPVLRAGPAAPGADPGIGPGDGARFGPCRRDRRRGRGCVGCR